jgi:predicted TIM-barrel fold metal-dependent hydrolase
MIVDCHTHIWQTPEQLGQAELGSALQPRRGPSGRPLPNRGAWRYVPAADPDFHMAQATAADKVIVLGFKSRYMKAEIPNRFVADYVNRFPHKLIGFAGIDPTERGAEKEVESAKVDLRLSGITVSPANQDFHPTDTRALAVYAEAERHNMPVLIHAGNQYTEHSKLEYARPYLFDEVARTFPKLRIIIAQLGQPWVDETICLLAKHQNVFADVSGLLTRQWQAYNALISAHQAGVIEKLLFGSDFPYRNVTDCIESLYNINQLAQGTNLPLVPREALRGIIERDALSLLGLG